MSAPSGYTPLDFVGFTDKGTYSPSATYMRNDLVHYGGNIMRCLIDNTTNVTPIVGANWDLWVGASANLVERVIAPLENNPADVAYGVGRQIIYDDWLWEVIAPIAVGDALVDYAVDPTNANIKKSAPVETQLLAVKAEADATDNMIAPTEANASSSSAAYAVGDQLILNNVLYTVTTAIAIGDALVSGTGGNIEASENLTDQLADKVDSSDLGTAAAKDSTNAVTQNSTDLVESGAVYTEVNTVKQALTTKADYVNVSLSGSESTLESDLNSVWSSLTNGIYFMRLSNQADIYHGSMLKYSDTIGSCLFTGSSGITYIFIKGVGLKQLTQKNDLTSIFQTNPTSSQAITKGTLFYLDNVLVFAKNAITNGDSFTENTNYEKVSNGGLNQIIASGSFNVTAATGLSVTNHNRKCGTSRNLSCIISGSSDFTTHQVVGTLAAADCPSALCYAVGVLYNGYSMVETCHMEIGTNGEIALPYGISMTGVNKVVITGTYFTT